MLGKRIINTGAAGAACTTDTVQILDGVPFESIATYQLDGAATSIPNNTYPGTENAITYSTGKFGQAAVFNGSSSYIQNSSLIRGAEYSVSVWIKTDTASGERMAIGWNWTGSQRFAIGIKDGGIKYQNGNSGWITILSSVSTNTWYNVIITSDSIQYNAYLDGNKIAAASGTGSIPASTVGSGLNLGRFGSNAGYWDGSIDQVRIYNKALSEDNVATLYAETVATASTNPTFNMPSGVAYYKMSDATDETGSYDGTPTNVNFNVAGKFGNAGEFNGSSSVITLPTALSDGATTNADCISFWFNVGAEVTSSTTNNEIMEFAYSGGTTGKIALGSTAGALTSETFSVSSDITTQYTYSRTNIPAGWNHAVVQWNSGTTKWDIYINGVAHTTYTFGTNEQGKWALKFGQRSSSYFNGKIDQVRIFNRAITVTEVETLYDEVQCIPTIVPTDNFNTVLYDGNGTTQSITSVGFQPDLIWVKNRLTSGENHLLSDVVSGFGKALFSNLSNQQIGSDNTYFSQLSNGFSINTNNGNISGTNNYVSWNWKAGGTAVSNTGGTITSTVSANQDTGFSIVKYTKSGTTNTIGHGLNSVPEIILEKRTDGAAYWNGRVEGITANNQTLYLNESNGVSTHPSLNLWTTPTGSVFGYNSANATAGDYIAYCFHSVDGYSKIGSYVGTKVSNDVSVTLGFRPAFIMVKRTDVSGYDWNIFDNKRDTINPNEKYLEANTADIEATGRGIDFHSNGFSIYGTSDSVNANGGKYIFLAIAEENVQPEPELANSFNVVTYTGNGGTKAVTGLGFQPDFVWIKSRDYSNRSHRLLDSVRGATKVISSGTSAAEYTELSLTSFDTNGFTLGSAGNQNNTSEDYVAWCWKASNDSTINNEGSISSVVSANPASGFSIVTYTGNTTAGATIGHGLNNTPELIIFKRRDASNNWLTVQTIEGVGGYLDLTNTMTTSNYNAWMNNTNPTDTLITLNNYTYINGGNMLAYCFHSVDGYQKIGSYTGTGSSGNTITTGFRPRFLMFKRTDSTGSWFVLDGIRNTSDVWSARLEAQSSNAEAGPDAYTVTVSSTGFEMTGSFATFSGANASGGTYIYLAIA